MKIKYCYRLRDKHSRQLSRMAQSVNTVWNYSNDIQKDAIKWGRRWPSGFDLNKLTAGSGIMLGLHSGTVNAVCEQYSLSRRQFRKRFLRYRGKGNLGWVPFKGRDIKFSNGQFCFFRKKFDVWLSRELPNGAKICDGSSFSQNARGQWFLSLVLDIPDVAKRDSKRSVGIDLGLKDLAVLSDGTRIEAPKIYRSTQEKLAKAQRAKKKRRVTAIHAKIASKRKDFLHKVSARIVRDFDQIIVGDVNAKALAQTTMAKSVNDAGWSMLRSQLRYKAIAHGAEYVEVSERFTTQICSDCGAIGGPVGIANLGIRHWECECGAVHDRDVNSAINIVRRGHATLAEGSAFSH